MTRRLRPVLLVLLAAVCPATAQAEDIFSTDDRPDDVTTEAVAEKPWTRDAWLATAPPSALRVESRGFHTSAHEALADALGAAAEALVDDVRAAILQADPACSARWTGPANRRRLQEHIERQLRAESDLFIADQFTRRFRRPYGDVWRAQALLNRGADKLRILAAGAVKAERRIDEQATSRQRSLKMTILSLAAMAAVIGLAYAFLNAATRGYYVWALRAAAAVLAVAGAFLLM